MAGPFVIRNQPPLPPVSPSRDHAYTHRFFFRYELTVNPHKLYVRVGTKENLKKKPETVVVEERLAAVLWVFLK